MCRDTSAKVKLVLMMCDLLGIEHPSFPNGTVAHMFYRGTTGIWVYDGHEWRELVTFGSDG